MLLAVVVPAGAFAASSEETYYLWLQTNNARMGSRVAELSLEPVFIIPMPVLFGVNPADLTADFGDRRSGGRRHEGQDILAPKGAPIVSPTKAVVLETGVWNGAGKYVTTANPGGEIFIYMHLDRVADLKPGELLSVGELIGYVGNTGNAGGGSPHLHIEIRKNGKAADPLPRLRGAFTIAEKMNFAAEIAEDDADAASFMAKNYRADLTAAKGLGIELPDVLTDALNGKTVIAKKPAVTATAAVATAPVPKRDLELKSKGADVTWLQAFLISTQSGPAATRLATVGATGYFGVATKAALAEYQKKSGISPASGYFGPVTRAHMTARVALR